MGHRKNSPFIWTNNNLFVLQFSLHFTASPGSSWLSSEHSGQRDVVMTGAVRKAQVLSSWKWPDFSRPLVFPSTINKSSYAPLFNLNPLLDSCIGLS